MADDRREPDDVLAFALWPAEREPAGDAVPPPPPAGPRERPRNNPRPRRRALVATLATVLGIGLVAAFLATLTWTQPHQSPVAAAILNIQIIGGATPAILAFAAVVLVAALCLSPRTPRFLFASGIGALAGVLAAAVVVAVASATNAFGVVLDGGVWAWAIISFALIGFGLANLFAARGWRLPVAVATVVVAAAWGTVGINEQFGLDPTIGALAGVSTNKIVALPVTKPTSKPAVAHGALWQTWKPPADMPTHGVIAGVEIPPTASHFKARPAELYLPPAARLKNPPDLPLVIFLMGQPGNPDASFQREMLDPIAAAHNGLAPIVLVVDQLGNPAVDPLCTDDTRYGKAQTYLTVDVVNWARAHLHVQQDPAHWTIGGYSNGGECALSLGVQYPNIWGNVLDISGEEYPGSDLTEQTLKNDFHGNWAAYKATWPLLLITRHTYPNTFGVFTVSSNDYAYLPQAKAALAAATKAGWKTGFYEIPNGGHVLGALLPGLKDGYTDLYPRLGLAAPAK